MQNGAISGGGSREKEAPICPLLQRGATDTHWGGRVCRGLGWVCFQGSLCNQQSLFNEGAIRAPTVLNASAYTVGVLLISRASLSKVATCAPTDVDASTCTSGVHNGALATAGPQTVQVFVVWCMMGSTCHINTTVSTLTSMVHMVTLSTLTLNARRGQHIAETAIVCASNQCRSVMPGKAYSATVLLTSS